jgi:Protein of unknown function (DUF3024)
MSIPADQLLIAEVGLAAFAGRVPEHVRDKVEFRFRRDGQSFILFEWRPRFMEPKIWAELGVAKFTYVQKNRTWKLFCLDRNLKWRRYVNLPESDVLEELLKEVDQDPLFIFWG